MRRRPPAIAHAACRRRRAPRARSGRLYVQLCKHSRLVALSLPKRFIRARCWWVFPSGESGISHDDSSKNNNNKNNNSNNNNKQKLSRRDLREHLHVLNQLENVAHLCSENPHHKCAWLISPNLQSRIACDNFDVPPGYTLSRVGQEASSASTVRRYWH